MYAACGIERVQWFIPANAGDSSPGHGSGTVAAHSPYSGLNERPDDHTISNF
jgi:hypothetical protein